MTQLDEALSGLRGHPGVEHVLLFGQDGLLVRHVGGSPSLDADTLAAMLSGIATTCSTAGRTAALGTFSTAVLEFSTGVAIVAELSSELLLAVLLRPGVGFAGLLGQLRQDRERLAGLI